MIRNLKDICKRHHYHQPTYRDYPLIHDPEDVSKTTWETVCTVPGLDQTAGFGKTKYEAQESSSEKMIMQIYFVKKEQ